MALLLEFCGDHTDVIRELEALLEKTDKTDEADQGEPDEHADTASVDSADEQALAAQIVETEERIASDLAAAGLTMDDTRGQTGEWLRLVARAERSRESLERIKSERRRLREEASELRDQLQRYLQARGVKPTEQQDTARAIADRLDSLPGPD